MLFVFYPNKWNIVSLVGNNTANSSPSSFSETSPTLIVYPPPPYYHEQLLIYPYPPPQLSLLSKPPPELFVKSSQSINNKYYFKTGSHQPSLTPQSSSSEFQSNSNNLEMYPQQPQYANNTPIRATTRYPQQLPPPTFAQYMELPPPSFAQYMEPPPPYTTTPSPSSTSTSSRSESTLDQQKRMQLEQQEFAAFNHYQEPEQRSIPSVLPNPSTSALSKHYPLQSPPMNNTYPVLYPNTGNPLTNLPPNTPQSLLQNVTVIMPNGFDSMARFDGIAQRTIPVI